MPIFDITIRSIIVPTKIIKHKNERITLVAILPFGRPFSSFGRSLEQTILSSVIFTFFKNLSIKETTDYRSYEDGTQENPFNFNSIEIPLEQD
jgi:hypothetical protein